jgi:hypothetical protein
MTNRLDRIEAILEQTVSIQQSNSRAISALSNQIAEMGQKLEASLENFTTTVNEALAAQDQRQTETSRQIQALIDNQQVNQREHTAFVQSFQAILAEIRALWERLAG